MDVIFETTKERRFSIEVGFFDTILEMKEKIQKYEGYPVSTWKLIFNGRVMDDDCDTEHYEVLQGSLIHLAVDSDNHPWKPPAIASATSVDELVAAKVQLTIGVPATRRWFGLECGRADMVSRLKERVQESEGIPAGMLSLFAGGEELQDSWSVADYGIGDFTKVSMVIRQQASSHGGGGGEGQKRLRIMVLPKCGTKKIAIEVSPSDNVGELRKELQRLHGQMQFHLPAEGYFFIYKQNVMDDARDFRWHDVTQGDTIEIFNGSVIGGS